MPEYLSPGVYVEEVDAGPKPIEGVSTSTVGFVGRAARGPTEGLPVLITSFPDFRRRFGDYLPDTGGNDHYLAHAVFGFFANGGKRCYVRRVVAGDASTTQARSDTAGAAAPVGGVVTRLAQNATSGATTVTLSSFRGLDTGSTLTFSQTLNGVVTTEAPVAVAGYNPATRVVTLGAALVNSYDSRYTSVTLNVLGATPVVIGANEPGAWGNAITVQIFPEYGTSAQVVAVVDAAAPFDTVQLSTANGMYVGAIVEFDRGATKAYGKVTAINGTSIDINPALAAATDLDPDGLAPTMARTCEFRITAAYQSIVEDFPHLSLDNTTNSYYAAVINNGSNLITVDDVPDNATTDPFTQPSGADGLNVTLAGGADGNVPDDADYIGVDNGPNQRTGIHALSDIDEISIIAVPGVTSQPVQNQMITHCELLLDRFAILDPEYALNSAIPEIIDQRNRYDSKYAALYFPKLTAFDPSTSSEITLPPSGHMAGIYARTDNERGVHKAPANTVLQSILGLDVAITKGEQDVLNPRGINAIRAFPGRGIRVWGARCITSDAAWRYVPVRRLFLFVEESIDEGTAWVVFEPNDYQLWARVRQSISNFLTRVWRDGALQGATPEEAFFVLCSLGTTMTQDDIDNGRLIIHVGIAPVKPAEFVIIRIQQYTAEANLARA
jgi:phage tail sheath protein FI